MNVAPVLSAPPSPAPTLVLPLRDPRATDVSVAGGKAARLAVASLAGFPVPDGFVVPTGTLAAVTAGLGDAPTEEEVLAAPLGTALRAALASAYAALGGPVAVRSSGVAEDLEGASFAGQYETVLDVDGVPALERAVSRCLASAAAARVRVYREERGIAAGRLAILVQRMVPARAAGVAFTAHPVTGERDVVVVSAVVGVGEALVSGAADAEEWEVRGDRAERRRMHEPVLAEDDAKAVAALAVRVAAGVPTDVEWAIGPDGVHLLQARPMTALPEPVRWEAPLPGAWLRNFRLGEWLGAPVTPLTESWLLTDLEEGMHRRFEWLFGMPQPRPLHVIVNGWYFYGLNADLSLGVVLRALPTLVRNLFRHFHEMMAVNPPTAHLGYRREVERWRTTLLPAWKAVVARLEERVADAPPAELRTLVQEAIDAAAMQLASIVGVAGYAAKVEGRLLAFWRRNLPGTEADVFDLVVGADVAAAAHDVEGLDWVLPTLGERGPLPEPPSPEVRARILERRAATEARVRSQLRPRAVAAFDALLAEARAAHAVRQEQTGAFTLAWPVKRRALARIGAHLVDRGVLVSADDVCFLTRDELDRALAGEALRPPVAARRATWTRQRALAPPLLLGELSGIFKEAFDQMQAAIHHDEHDAPDALPGMPGSPGRVTGLARVIRGVDELHRLRAGEILVCPVTTPGWTPAFARAAAIVTDTGSVASHASIVAREHGIPAVVGTGFATARIVDGQRITVDGGRGVVRLSG